MTTNPEDEENRDALREFTASLFGRPTGEEQEPATLENRSFARRLFERALRD